MKQQLDERELHAVIAESVSVDADWPEDFADVQAEYSSSGLDVAVKNKIRAAFGKIRSGPPELISITSDFGILHTKRSDDNGYLFSGVESGLDQKALVSEAYVSMFRRLPEDHVVIDDLANAEFVHRCRELGATCSEFQLNHWLMNCRKAGRHTGIDRIRPQPLPKDVRSRIGFASEIGARLVQYEYANGNDISLDRIFCNPKYRSRFDYYCQLISPGFTSYSYRLAALAARKDARKRSSRVSAAPSPRFHTVRMDEGFLSKIPSAPGVYQIMGDTVCLYAGHADNLRARVKAHLLASRQEELAAMMQSLFEIPTKIMYASGDSMKSSAMRVEAQERIQRVKRPALNFVAA